MKYISYDWGMYRVQPDPDYDFVKPVESQKKGIQCGLCGQKFEYGQAYGYCCQRNGCPTGFGGR